MRVNIFQIWQNRGQWFGEILLFEVTYYPIKQWKKIYNRERRIKVNEQFLTCPFYDVLYHRCKHAGEVDPYAVICCYLITGNNDICLQDKHLAPGFKPGT